MSKLLEDIAIFRGDKLFNGAVNIGWFETDELKASLASSAFVFHGPAYHGVSQTDVGISHGHSLQDTASFTRAICHRCYGLEDQPFTLAIAGYGTGKSHLALTIATLLANPTGSQADRVLSSIEVADYAIAQDIKAIITENQRPNLVVALNGMQSVDLAAEVFRQIINQVKRHGLDTRLLDQLRPRFASAASLIRMAEGNQGLIDELLVACETESVDDILQKLECQDDAIYENVYNVLASRNIKISVLGGESVRDVIDIASREYCGPGKQFKSLIILFDEFGRYTEFATVKSHVAGSGVLQDMFESIQSNAGKVCFVGFIQFELSAYVQRVAPEHRNEILRYVTRYQASNKVYLSINLETLIASLIEKKNQNYLSDLLDNENARKESNLIVANISKWFPVSQTHRLWTDSTQFHNVVRKGCWPLSPYSTWLLFHFAAAGKHLQERSVLALLGDVFERYHDSNIPNSINWVLNPVDLWSDALQDELITSEEGGQQGAITHSYLSIIARYGVQLTVDQTKLLRSIVLASKLGLKCVDQDDAIEALSELSGLLSWDVLDVVKFLREELNIIEWDEAFKQFDILGDAIPRTQFLAFIRQRVASAYDEVGKAALFANKVSEWCDLLTDLECDYAEQNKITTREWCYKAVTSNLSVLSMHLKQASDRWLSAVSTDEPRGEVIYCYIEPSHNISLTEKESSQILRKLARDVGVAAQPILVVLLYDEDGKLGQSLAELSILEQSLTSQEIAKFGNLVDAHKQKMRDDIRSRIEDMIKCRRYITAFKEPLESTRIGKVGTEIFSRIYKSQLTFPFDGFTTTRGNAAITCRGLITDLLQGRLDWNSIIVRPIMEQNRATVVLRDSWRVFANNGTIRTRPESPIVRGLTERWDAMLANEDQRILLQQAMKNLCAPPFGANIASAGLFLGVFIAPRLEKISIVKSGQILSVAEWMHEDLFRGNVLDIGSWHDVELVLSGELSSEWERLLDEWESAESYASQYECYIKAEGLKERIPVPSSQYYRLSLLEGRGTFAIQEIEKVEEAQDQGIEKMEKGLERSDVAPLSKGAVELFDLIKRMTEQKPRWTDNEIEKIKQFAERSRQSIIQIFPDWLKKQTPRTGAPEAVGDFKHKMIHFVGGNLQKLNLKELHDELITYTALIIRKAELVASIHQMVNEVDLWLTTNAEVTHFVRIKQLRLLQKTGADYAAKLRGIADEIDMPEITRIRTALSERLDELKQAQLVIKRRYMNLWEVKMDSIDTAEELQDEVEELISIFEGCTDDLEDLHILRKALRIYAQAFRQLNNDRMTSIEFQLLADKIIVEARDALIDDEPPWDPEETIETFKDSIAKNRYEKSLEWIRHLEEEALSLMDLDVNKANSLHNRALSPPLILDEDHKNQLDKIIIDIEIRLNDLKVEWLIEKFRELTRESQKQFISMIVKN